MVKAEKAAVCWRHCNSATYGLAEWKSRSANAGASLCCGGPLPSQRAVAVANGDRLCPLIESADAEKGALEVCARARPGRVISDHQQALTLGQLLGQGLATDGERPAHKRVRETNKAQSFQRAHLQPWWMAWRKATSLLSCRSVGCIVHIHNHTAQRRFVQASNRRFHLSKFNWSKNSDETRS